MAAPTEAVVVDVSLADDFHAFVAVDLGTNAILNYEQVTGCANKLKTWLTNQDNREMLPSHVISDLAQVLEQMAKTLTSTSLSKEPSLTASVHELDLATECLRCLRNSCADCRSNQEAVSRTPTLFVATKSLLLWSLKHMGICETMHKSAEARFLDSQKRTTSVAGVLRSGIQFLGNAVIDQGANAKLVWKIFTPVFKDLLQCQDIVVCDYVAMVIYNVIKMDRERIKWLISDKEGQGIVVAVIDNLSRHNLHWCLCLLQSLLVEPTCMQHLFPILTVVQRQLLLEVALQLLDRNGAEVLSKQNTLDGVSSRNDVASENVQFIAAEFKTKACTIIGLHCQEDKSDEEGVALLTVTYLDVLCSATSNHHGDEALRNDVDLLKCAINLLHCMRMIGMEGSNIFSNISKMADSQVVMATEEGHPIHGLKKSLIRLIGNMSYCNKAIQDQVRELGGIPLIMEHMNIDTRNEYIMQWAIVAIRNLCKDNMANQTIIADTKLTAIADNVGLLRDFGVDAEISGDKIVIKKVEGKDLPPIVER